MTATVIVTGSRSWVDRAAIVNGLCWLVDTASVDEPLELHHGAARGADTLAAATWQRWHEAWPELFAAPVPHPADWAKHGRRAGPSRNSELVAVRPKPLACATFALPGSIGTPDCAKKARAAGIPTRDFGMPTIPEENT